MQMGVGAGDVVWMMGFYEGNPLWVVDCLNNVGWHGV